MSSIIRSPVIKAVWSMSKLIIMNFFNEGVTKYQSTAYLDSSSIRSMICRRMLKVT